MHDYKTCEISLLLRSNSSVWSQKTSMFGLQKNLVNPSKETRATKDSFAIRRIKTSLLRKIYPWSLSQAPTWNQPCQLPVSIPSSLAPFCYTFKATTAASRPVGSSGRWSLLLLPKKNLGALFDRTQVFLRQKGYFFGPDTPSKQRKRRTLETSLCDGYSPENQTSNPSSRRRQFKRYEENHKTRRMASSTLPFSFNPEIPSPTPPTETCFEGWCNARRSLPIGVPNSRDPKRASVGYLNRPTRTISQKSLYHISNPGYDSGLSLLYKLLPNLFKLPRVKLAIHNQRRRVDGQYYSRSFKAKPFSLQSSSTLAMGHNTDSITKGIKLQWQESSTDLINPTPNCDRFVQPN